MHSQDSADDAPALGCGIEPDSMRRRSCARSVPSLRAGRLIALLAAFGLAVSLAGSADADSETLDVSRMKLVFDDEFHDLSISAHGPGTTWIAHTPWNGDFGDAAFTDPMPGFPFTLTPNGLRIEMRKLPDGRWQSGLIASTDPAGNGFKRRYGYFEINTKLPAGPGIWPAFWLDSRPPPDSPDPSLEIDIFEHYGKFPGNYNSSVGLWPKPGHGEHWYQMKINEVPAGSLSERFHTYGVKVDPTWITFYFDRKETWRVKTPVEHKHGLTILADLGLGSGWPIDQTPNPSFMDIRYIRVYEDPSVAASTK